MSNVIVIYHAHCSDGLGAAWAFRRAMPDATFHAAMHDGSPPPDVEGKEVYIVDYSYPPKILLEMKAKAKSLVLLDHHKSAMEKCGFTSSPDVFDGEIMFVGHTQHSLPGLPISQRNVGRALRELKVVGHSSYGTHESVNDGRWISSREDLKTEFPTLTDELLDLAEICTFDMNRSGAGMAWDYLFPNEKRHWLIDYTEDKDIWRWTCESSREVNSALQSYPLTFEAMDELSKRHPLIANHKDALRVEGETILRANRNMIDSIVNKAREIEMQGHKVMCVNSPVLQSEIGNYLSKNKPFAAVWFENEHGEKIYSLRSSDGGVDVSKIAAAYGGGGHAKAAGFRLTVGQGL